MIFVNAPHSGETLNKLYFDPWCVNATEPSNIENLKFT